LRRTGGEDRREDRPTMYYPLISPDGTEIYPIGPTGYESRWMCAKETAEELEKNGLLEWKITIINGEETWHPYQKYYLENRTKKPGNIWKDLCYTEEGIDLFLWEDVEGNKKATREVKSLFNGFKVFDSPKSVSLLKKILMISTYKDDYVLDFFSGSATSAEACMRLNDEENYDLKYIMVQIPEEIPKTKDAYKLGFRTIDEVGRARIKKAANKIKEETNADIDYGYKLYYLESPQEKTLVDLENFEPEIKFIIEDMVSVFDNERSSGKESILATWLNEDGYGLTATSKPYALNSYIADLIEKSLYIIDEGLEEEDVMTLIKRIENEELNITRVILYVHSVRFNVLQELRKNLKVLRNNKNVTLIERF
ncbi:MAG: DNA methyltransferase, partial [Tissierellia bacterium]|nr:DNA methyltransferase [Tissierellia bacterium]